jgi:epoxyqueuosine reductase
MERELAERAGLGWVGKNTLLINPRLGSWFFLGEVVTTLEIAGEAARVADHCGTCTRCIDACPTGALEPYRMDARRCVSYLTIEHRGAIDEPGLRRGMGDWLFGCDVCQEVCPHNSAREGGPIGAANPAYGAGVGSLDAARVAGWTEEDRRRELGGSAMKRAKLEMWKRNAAIALENAGAARGA